MSKPIVVICMWTAPLHVIRLNEPLYGTSMPGAGTVHHIRLGLLTNVRVLRPIATIERTIAVRDVANLHSPRREAWIYDLPSAFSSRHRQPLGIKQSDLHEDAGLVPINILVGNLAVFEADNDSYGHLNWFPCWGDARQ